MVVTDRVDVCKMDCEPRVWVMEFHDTDLGNEVEADHDISEEGVPRVGGNVREFETDFVFVFTSVGVEVAERVGDGVVDGVRLLG